MLKKRLLGGLIALSMMTYAMAAQAQITLNYNPSITSTSPVQEYSLPKYILIPDVFCTEIACPAGNPCCNSCTFNGWKVENTNLKVQSVGNPLPNCIPNGCGGCPMQIQSYGYPDKLENAAIFYATQWVKSETPEPSPFNPTPMPDLQEDIVDPEEQQEALKKWFGELEKESQKNMEKIKQENPEQYEQMQQLINVFQNAGQQGAQQGNPLGPTINSN